MRKKEIAKRYILLVFGLFFSAFGVAVTRHGELGVSPISSVANVLGLKITSLSMGEWLMIWNCILIVGQILILRKEFKLVQLLQLPVSLLFGLFMDIGTACVSHIPADAYPARLIFAAAGVFILGFGISLSVTANVVMNSGEAFVKAISDKSGITFGNVKIGFDIISVLLSLILSMLFFGGKIVGAREGTVIAAVGTGLSVKLCCRLLKKTPLEKFICK